MATGRLPGTQTKKTKEVDDAADQYVAYRDKRIALLADEVEAKEALIAVMKKHKLKVYKDAESGRSVTLTQKPPKDDVQVKEPSKGGD